MLNDRDPLGGDQIPKDIPCQREAITATIVGVEAVENQG